MSRILLLALVAALYLPMSATEGQLLRRNRCGVQRPLFQRPLLAERTHRYRIVTEDIELIGQYCPYTLLYKMGNMYWYEHIQCTNPANKSYDCYDTQVSTGCTPFFSCYCGSCRTDDPSVNDVGVGTAVEDVHADVTITYGDAGDVDEQRCAKFDFGTGDEFFRIVKVEIEGESEAMFFGQPTDDAVLQAGAKTAEDPGGVSPDFDRKLVELECDVEDEGTVRILVIREP